MSPRKCFYSWIILLLIRVNAADLVADLSADLVADLPASIADEVPQTYSERLQAVRDLNAPLSPQEQTRLLDYIASRFEDATEREPGREAAIRNDLLARLGEIGVPPDALAVALTQALASPESIGRWRDFCLQHLGQLYPDLSSAARAPVRAMLLEATRDKTDALAGTALLALRNALSLNELATHILRVALDDEFSEASRATALNLAANLPPDSRVLTIARDHLARTPGHPRASLPLRLAALTLLGETGTPEDFNRIATYHTNPLPPLQLAAHRATRALEHRHPSDDHPSKR